MRISTNNPGGIQPPVVSDSNHAARTVATSDSPGAVPAGQNPPALGASVVKLTATALGQPDVRTAKVNALRQQIASGTYAPSLPATADKMLGDPMNDLDGDGHG